MKKTLAMLLAAVMLVTAMPFWPVSAASGGLSLAQLKEKYPHGAYWNHTGTANKPGSYTWEPCLHHNSCDFAGSCGCNSYDGAAIQCMGFAYQLASLAYDCDPRGEWSANYSASALNTLKAGDIVRYKNNSHSIFITAVSGDAVTYADCNSDLHCQIKWNQTTTKAALKSTFTYVKAAPYALEAETKTPVLTILYHANGGTIEAGDVTGYRYTVTDPEGVNMRSGAGTGNQVLTALSCGTVFTVKKGDTKTAGGYTWGKTTVGDHTGWVVISDFVEKIATLREGTYYLADSLVYKTADNTPLTHKMTYKKTTSGGLKNAATLGIQREGYRFEGWCTRADGDATVHDQDDTALKPETIYPELKNGSATVTLYAVWGCDHRYSIACDTTCNKCGAIRMISHQYTNDCDPDCDVCGAERDAPHVWELGSCADCGKTSIPPEITVQPTTAYAKMGATVKTAVTAQGDGLTYQWYIKNAGAKTYKQSSIKTATYKTTMTAASKNRVVYCVVKDQYGNKLQTKKVTLREAAGITTQPATTYTKKGDTAQVTVKASGDGLTYQWYIKNAGAAKYSRSSVKKATYSTAMSAASKNRTVYCVVKDKWGKTVQTKEAILREAVSITTQPKTVTVAKGKTAQVTVKASGDGLTYQWYYKNAGAAKYAKSSIKTATYKTTMTAARKNRTLYCVVTDKWGNTVKTVTVTLKMK